MSKNFDFDNTSIPTQMSIDVRDLCSGVWPDDRTRGFFHVLFKSIASYLKVYQTKSEGKVVFKLKDEKGEFKFGAMLVYQKPEEDSEEDSGNWYLEFTFNEEDIGDDVIKEIDNMSDVFYKIMGQHAYDIMSGSFRSSIFMNKLSVIAIDVLIKFLDMNAIDAEDVNVIFRGIFTASIAVEGGKKIMSIVPGETIKQVIKEDSAL